MAKRWGQTTGVPDWLTATLLGIIEGITEFLPISSTGHLLLSQQLGWLEPQSDVFNIAIQSGAVIAVLFNFTDRVKQLTFRWREPAARDYLAKLFVAFVITGAGGLVIDQLGFELPKTVLPVAVALLAGGVLFVVVENKIGNRAKLAEVTWAIAIAIGFGQLLAAVFPGTSRSGATILIALLMGLRRVPAIEFTFLLGVPTLLTAGAYKVFKALRAESVSEDWGQLALATGVSAVTAFVSVRWLLRYIETHTFVAFGWYRIALGMVLLVFIIS
ncbi:MAG: undecaprenyl-diphosphate phosphatase [Verrucomicrobiota bacterium]|nr:undecaprenyl-diphosphate phosphatase [Verrucomicrobiota bacterium]